MLRNWFNSDVRVSSQGLPSQSSYVAVVCIFLSLQLPKVFSQPLFIHLSHHPGFGAGGFAKMGLKLLIAGVGDLHNTIADDTRDNTTNHGECEEERL